MKDICEINYWSEQVTGQVSLHQEDTWQMKGRLLRASENRHLHAPQTEAHSFTKDLQKGDQLTNTNSTTATRARREANPHKAE